MATLWHYLQQGQTQGPVAEDQLKALVASGALGGDDLVWQEGTAEWRPVRDVPALAPAPARIELDLPPERAAGAVPASASPWTPSGAWGGGGSAVSPEAVDLLRATRPWVRFMAVLGFIAVGVMVLVACGAGAVAILGRRTFPTAGAAMALVYLLMAALHLPPALYLNRYASRIGDLVARGGAGDLQAALAAQKSFWRYVGIFTVVMLCFYVVLVGVAVAAGAALRGFR